jgi:hypothetical protein
MQPIQVGCVSRTITHLPRFAWWRERLIAAEASSGWLDECDDAGRFLAVSQELVEALAPALRRFAGSGPVLEVCAGSGALVHPLAALGVHLQATDAAPPEGSEVLRLSAQAALCQFRPAVVLGVFVPHDAGVDEAVLACPSVQHYVIVNARIGPALGSASLWRTPGWKAEPLEDVRPWVLTRHDVWLGDWLLFGRLPGEKLPVPFSGKKGRQDGDILQHGEAWHFTRAAITSSIGERSIS